MEDSEKADADLLRSFAVANDHEAFAEVVRRHSKMVLAVARSIVRDPADADDVFQAVFIRLAQKARSGVVRNVGGWLHHVTRQMGLDGIRLRARYGDRLERYRTMNVPQAQKDNEPDEDARRVVHEEIDRLPDRLRLPVIACYFEDLGQEIAAQRMGCSRSLLSRRLTQARELLRRRLGRRHVLAEGDIGSFLGAAIVAEPVSTSLMDSTVQSACAFVANGVVGDEGPSLSPKVTALLERSGTTEVPSLLWRIALVASTAFVVGGMAVYLHMAQPWRGTGLETGAETTWGQVESVTGEVAVRRADRRRVVEKGDLVRSGDRIQTMSNQEVVIVSGNEDRILLREHGELTVGDLGRRDGGGCLLERGAVVARSRQGLGMGTPHSLVVARDASFFLMVPRGVTTNGTAWSFTRLDVTDGSATFRPVATSNTRSEIIVAAGQSACAGTDSTGAAIVSAPARSEGRELSPSFGGVFFREYADIYKAGHLVVDTTRFRDGKTWELGPTDLWVCVTGPIPEGCVEVRRIKSGDAAPVTVLYMKPSTAGKLQDVRMKLPVPRMGSFVYEFSSRVLAVQGNGQFGYGGEGVAMGDTPAVSSADSKSRRGDGRTDSGYRYRIELVRVGTLPCGVGVCEERAWEAGRLRSIRWTRDTEPNLSFNLFNIAVGIEEVRVKELVRQERN